MKNKVYLDNNTLESIKEEGIYPTIIELTTEDCPECYDAARSAYWSQARGVTTCNPTAMMSHWDTTSHASSESTRKP